MSLKTALVALGIFIFLSISQGSVYASDKHMDDINNCIVQKEYMEDVKFYRMAISSLESDLRKSKLEEIQELKELRDIIDQETISLIRDTYQKVRKIEREVIEEFRNNLNGPLNIINEYGLTSWCICKHYLRSRLASKIGVRMFGDSKRRKMETKIIEEYSAEKLLQSTQDSRYM